MQLTFKDARNYRAVPQWLIRFPVVGGCGVPKVWYGQFQCSFCQFYRIIFRIIHEKIWRYFQIFSECILECIIRKVEQFITSRGVSFFWPPFSQSSTTIGSPSGAVWVEVRSALLEASCPTFPAVLRVGNHRFAAILPTKVGCSILAFGCQIQLILVFFSCFYWIDDVDHGWIFFRNIPGRLELLLSLQRFHMKGYSISDNKRYWKNSLRCKSIPSFVWTTTFNDFPLQVVTALYQLGLCRQHDKKNGTVNASESGFETQLNPQRFQPFFFGRLKGGIYKLIKGWCFFSYSFKEIWDSLWRVFLWFSLFFLFW